MNSKARLVEAILCESPDRVPVALRPGRFIEWLYGRGDWRGQLKATEDFNCDGFIYVEIWPPDPLLWSDAPFPKQVRVKRKIVTENGKRYLVREVETPKGSLREVRRIVDEYLLVKLRSMDIVSDKWYSEEYPLIKEYFVKDYSDLDALEYLLNPFTGSMLKELKDAVMATGSKGIVHASFPSPVNEAVHAYGLKNLLVACYREPGFVRELLEIFQSYLIDLIQLVLSETAVDAIHVSWCYTSLSSGWSPRLWEKYIEPLVKEQVEVTHIYGGFYHYYDDGECMRLLPLLKDSEIDILSTLPPPPLGDADIAEAKKIVGDKICLVGNLDIQLLRYGKPGEVLEAARRIVHETAPYLGFILGPSDGLHAHTPLENVKAYVKAAEKYPIADH
ncbi:MAG: hypothetical protein DRN04_02150 [Thermoprotei archaeon]|nr:MAG: hypothetical protein DRN04_02150 [Thermoprotei archaeon]